MKKYIVLLLLIIMPLNILAYSDKIIPGGQTLGIEVKNDGIIVIGFYRVNGKLNKNNLKVGDIITKINNTDVTSIDDMVDLISKNISDNKVNGQYCEDRLFDGTKETAEIYNKNIMNIKRLVDKKEIDDNLKNLNGIYESSKWGELFKEYCEKNNSKFLDQKHFADALNIDFILSNIKDKDIEQIYEFLYSLQKIYNSSNIKKYYETDKNILINFKNNLSNIDNIDKVKKFVVNKIVDFLEQIIEIL